MWSAFVFLSSLRLLFLNPTLSFRGVAWLSPSFLFFLLSFRGQPGIPPLLACLLSGGDDCSPLFDFFISLWKGLAAPIPFFLRAFWISPFFFLPSLLGVAWLSPSFLSFFLGVGEGGCPPLRSLFLSGGGTSCPHPFVLPSLGGMACPPSFLSFCGGRPDCHPCFYYCLQKTFVSG